MPDDREIHTALASVTINGVYSSSEERKRRAGSNLAAAQCCVNEMLL